MFDFLTAQREELTKALIYAPSQVTSLTPFHFRFNAPWLLCFQLLKPVFYGKYYF
jgi:hypothetical protein